MKPAPFRYADPGSLDEALAVLASEGEGAKVLAGGQSLIPLLSMRLATPATLVDINRVPGLDTVEATGDGVRVGALVRHSQLLRDPTAARVQPLLARAGAFVAHPAIRNRGTTHCCTTPPPPGSSRCSPGRRRTSRTRRSATGGRRSARSRTPTPPAR